ncbi:MAG: serine/threonine-protein kinase [Bifidobacterium sp.]|uniref:serine/threonine-protein kinase n=1 Tax=Bifidobacterium sp. TaxID=41200 RepID=UPI003F0FA842
MTISAPLSLGGPHERPVARPDDAKAWYSSSSTKSTQVHRIIEAFRTTQAAQTGITEHAVGRIPGYTPITRLGSGSEAEVCLYRQHVPDRLVAIKISKQILDSQVANRFRSESDFMGQISAHPYILSIYGSGITATGHGYTVFEYAPGGNFKAFLEHDRLTADQMLTIGIDLASALFAAHRKGIIHRDIKPSNILINAQHMPMLADFGIAGTIYGGPGVGFTVAWAPPEVLANGGGGNEASDIYSLGATLFAMVTGQSPYEYAYADDLGDSHRRERAERLQAIILAKPLPAFHRPDIPAPVERVLHKAMSWAPEDRYYSALEFARDMQRAQQEVYGHATRTTIEGEADAPADLRPVSQASPQSLSTAIPHKRSSWVKPLVAVLSVVAAITVLALVFVFAVAPNMDTALDNSAMQVSSGGIGDNHAEEQRKEDDPDSAVTSGSVPQVHDLTGTYNAVGDKVTFTWINPEPQDGDTYAWAIVGDTDAPAGAQGTLNSSTSIEIDSSGEAHTCIQVSLIRADRRMSDTPAMACAIRP